MRVSHCKPYCPSVCFSRSSGSLHPPCTVKLEDVRNVVPSPTSVASVVEEKVSDEKADEVEKHEPEDAKPEVSLKSCLKKSSSSDDSGSGVVEKRNIKWMDVVGKELVEIKEFDSVELGDPEDNDGGHFCACVIQ